MRPKKNRRSWFSTSSEVTTLFSCSADSFINRAFGVTGDNVRDLGNGLVVDKGTIGTLPDFALKHMATIGNRHGTSDHAEGIRRCGRTEPKIA